MTTAPLLQINGGSLRRPSPELSVTKRRPSRDAPVLRELLELHAVARPRIVDCTYGRGLIWGRLPIRRTVIKVDVNAELAGLDVVCDWLDLARYFEPGSVDVLVWDPIHVSDVGESSRLYQRYVAAENVVRGTTAVAELFGPFLEVAVQIVKSRTGIVLVKMCDQVHCRRYQWQVFELIAEARGRGWTACQPRVLFNSARPPATSMHRQAHTRNNVTWWIVLRNGPACHGPGRLVQHELRCRGCGERFWARRLDALTCSARCRMRVRRQ